MTQTITFDIDKTARVHEKAPEGKSSVEYTPQLGEVLSKATPGDYSISFLALDTLQLLDTHLNSDGIVALCFGKNVAPAEKDMVKTAFEHYAKAKGVEVRYFREDVPEKKA